MATPVTGLVTSFTLTTGAKVNFDELIYLLSPTDLPMTLGVDAEGTMVVRSEPVDQTTFYWQNEELLLPRLPLAAAVVTADGTLTVAAGEGFRFATGDIARVMKAAGSEVVRVDGISANGVTLTVSRAQASTTATTFASGDIIMGIGATLNEGSDPQDFRSRDRDTTFNYTEIFGPYKIQMSRSAQKIARYGVSDEWAHQVYNRTRETMIRIEQAILYGARSIDTTNKRRSTGGLLSYMTNIDATSTSLTVAAILAQQQAAYNAGDVPMVLVANPNSLTDLNEVGNTSIIRTVNTDSRRGRARVEVIDTEFGSTTLMRNRWVHPYNAFLVKSEGIIRRIFDPLMYEVLAKTGDSDSAQIVAEEGYEIKGTQHMAAFTNLSTYTRA